MHVTVRCFDRLFRIRTRQLSPGISTVPHLRHIFLLISRGTLMRTLCATLEATCIRVRAPSGSVLAISNACFHSSFILAMARRLSPDCLSRFLRTDFPQIDVLSDTS
jgi:hypothetical protein